MKDIANIPADEAAAVVWLRSQYTWTLISGILLMVLFTFPLCNAASGRRMLLLAAYGLLGIGLAVAHAWVVILRFPRNISTYALRHRTGGRLSANLLRYSASFCTLREFAKALIYWAIGLTIAFAGGHFPVPLVTTGPAFCVTASLICLVYAQRRALAKDHGQPTPGPHPGGGTDDGGPLDTDRRQSP